MKETVIKLIEQYSTIIIHRHNNPDGDAYGSQLGLKHVIELNYPEKQVYAVGDENVFSFLGDMDHIEDDVYDGALAIIVDVCVKQMISDHRYELADEVLILDHHLNTPNIECVAHIDSSKIACAEMIVDILTDYNLQFNAQAATAFLAGIITDSGRFLYSNTQADTLEISAFLLRRGGALQWIYENLYTEELNFKKLKGYFINNFKIYRDHIAYMENSMDVTKEYNVSTFTVSRAMVNQMSGIKGIDAWVNFTEDEVGIMVELRSKETPIVDIAKQYGGGGHALACGCVINSFEETNQLLDDLHEHIVRSQNNG
ncbi:MAG: bifunctional oligoribonuclease/PAP phosphatase NrnA [Candidatus Izimaplasma sp.]|nr:bifunctional oligoribonuclease/PAP phosphatase NrnA [Candidatus Izimaplasma bacterium]